MKLKTLLATGILALGLLAAACGGGGDDDGGNATTGGSSGAVIPAADADRVAHEALPTVEDLPGEGWLMIGEDQFDSGSGADFLEFIQGNPECETLQNLATLQDVFGGGDEGDAPVGRAQVEFENQDPDALIPTSIEVEIEIDESAAASRGEFTLVKELFESEETSNCIISVLNNQFAESGPAGVEIEVKAGSGSASPPEDGARMAFDIDMSIAGIELAMAMQMYFWPYGNANVQVLFLGTNETLTSDLVGDVLEATDEKLKTAAGD